MRGPVVYCLGVEKNPDLFQEGFDPRSLILDPDSIGEPFPDDSIRPDGLAVRAKFWTEPDRSGSPVDAILTEFPDPSGREIYFQIPQSEGEGRITIEEDEIVSD